MSSPDTPQDNIIPSPDSQPEDVDEPSFDPMLEIDSMMMDETLPRDPDAQVARAAYDTDSLAGADSAANDQLVDVSLFSENQEGTDELETMNNDASYISINNNDVGDVEAGSYGQDAPGSVMTSFGATPARPRKSVELVDDDEVDRWKKEHGWQEPHKPDLKHSSTGESSEGSSLDLSAPPAGTTGAWVRDGDRRPNLVERYATRRCCILMVAVLVLVLAPLAILMVTVGWIDTDTKTDTITEHFQADQFPTYRPSKSPTGRPTLRPFARPTYRPTQRTQRPSVSPSAAPTDTKQPSDSPSQAPTLAPSVSPRPSSPPSFVPSDLPSDVASQASTGLPSDFLSDVPSDMPSMGPTGRPTASPSQAQTTRPTSFPTLSSAPTTHAAELVLPYLTSVTDAGLLQDVTSPQGRAANWLQSDELTLQAIQQGSVVLTPNGTLAEADLTDAGTTRVLQRYALLALDFALHSGSGDTYWSFPQLDECQWPGVTCNGDGEIVKLKWNNQSLDGYVPPEITLLTSLDTVDFADNSISGFLDEFWGISSLKNLYLFNNSFMGSISPDVSKLSDLEAMYLAHNELTGELPTNLMDNEKLRYLIVNHNGLSGELPSDLRHSEMFLFDLSHNQFFGQLPDFKMDKLKHLHLDHNGFTGQVPDSFRYLGNQRMWEIDISSNHLTGGLPSGAWHAHLPNHFLTNFVLNNNSFTEPIPSSICLLDVYDEGELVELRAECDICSCKRLCKNFCG